MAEKAAERRRTRRVGIRLPVRVQGRDPNGTKWEEMTACEDAAAGGVALVLKRPVRVGQVLHLTLALPPRFRQYDLTLASYRVYGLVRARRSGNRCGIQFLGRHPPRGAEALPAGLFLMPGDARPGGAGQQGFEVVLRLDANDAPGGVAQEERSIAENAREREIDVKVTSLPVVRGAVITIEEVAGDFRSRAEVRGISIGPDGVPHLSLFILDARLPPRLLPSAGHDEAPPGS